MPQEKQPASGRAPDTRHGAALQSSRVCFLLIVTLIAVSQVFHVRASKPSPQLPPHKDAATQAAVETQVPAATKGAYSPPPEVPPPPSPQASPTSMRKTNSRISIRTTHSEARSAASGSLSMLARTPRIRQRSSAPYVSRPFRTRPAIT